MELATLRKQRGQIKAHVTRFVSYYTRVIGKTIVENEDLEELEIRISTLANTFSEFEAVQSQIEVNDSTDLDEAAESIYREEFEDLYYKYRAKASHLIKSYREKSVTPSPFAFSANIASSTPVVENSIKLPTIQLPSFNGNYDNWYGFKDTFLSLIHRNQSLTEIQKFHYLKLSLKDDAAKVIHALETSDRNYLVAWELLQKRFENKKVIIKNHINAILNLQVISRESFSKLREFLDNFNKHIEALKNLGQPVENWYALLIPLLSNKLDHLTRREWETNVAKDDRDELPTLDEFKHFLERRCRLLETLNTSSTSLSNTNAQNSQKTFPPKTKQSSFVASERVASCEFCKKPHFTFQCADFISLPQPERLERVKTLYLCINCLRKGHTVRDCRSLHFCKTCKRKHHTLLHIDRQPESNVSVVSASASNSNDSISEENATSTIVTTSVNHYLQRTSLKQVLLSTAIVLIADQQGRVKKCRALLDCGSQSNFMTSELCSSLGLKTNSCKLTIVGVGQKESNVLLQTATECRSQYNAFAFRASFFVLPQITGNTPQTSFDLELTQTCIPKNVQLADPEFNTSGKIDILLGSGIFWELLCIGQIKLGPNKPILQKTKFGWIISGNLCHPTTYVDNKTICNLAIDQGLEAFWKLEDCQAAESIWTVEEQHCSDHFEKNTKRNVDGRFVVSVPLKENVKLLGNSKENALKRIYALERKLNNNLTLKNQYTQCMQEYKLLNHMRPIDETTTPNLVYYLPHHCIVREASITTKMRVVFDASAETDTGISLNNIQMVGPVTQRDLFSLLISFRKHTYALTADIEKMYRQILLNDKNKPLHRIFWRENSSQPVLCFELQTVTYGTASAPYLATRCLQQLALDFSKKLPLASRIIQNDFYMDDLITGSDSEDTLIAIQTEVDSILKTAGFHLRKWLSNSERVVEKIASEHNLLTFGETSETKTLGVTWNSFSDSLQYTITVHQSNYVTKRVILGAIAKIFDPLGLLGPVTVTAKLILQQLWQLKLSWDESLPLDLYTKWIKFRNNLSSLNSLAIPRHVSSRNTVNIQLHGFGDASTVAYGACIYIRSVDSSGNISIRLLCAKSRVAPIKTISLPRLELCAMLLLSNLVNKVFNGITLEFNNIYLWSDSKIALSWVQSCPSKWQTFVSNRVAEIQRLSDVNNWYYIKTTDNPADLLTRGIKPQSLINSHLWWHGPSWLANAPEFWPAFNERILELEKLPEYKLVKSASVVVVTPELELFRKYSSLTRLQRITAYCLRFINNSKKPKAIRNLQSLSIQELQDALMLLVKIAQKESFSNEIDCLLRHKAFNFKNNLQTLNPILDKNQILRVGGRLKYTNFAYDKKHPILLPKGHPLTRLIINHEHIRLLHCGAQNLLSSLRERYRPIGARNLIRKIIHDCIICFKTNPKSVIPQMGNLPLVRFNIAPIFHTCGVDYAGPIYLKDKRGRGNKTTKAYIALFICLTTRAIHIELVSDLTTQMFLAALRRFIARRGKPRHIHSDNATTFAGANSELKNLQAFLEHPENKDKFISELANEGIQWHFIPPHSPHFGGSWEAGIKSCKFHLKRIMGNASLVFEDLYTILVHIESILNSRPLCPLSSDPTDLSPLTPGHFLVGRPLSSIPEEDVTQVPENRLNHYKRLQQLVQHFWARWSTEYISELQQRLKWKGNLPTLVKKDALVVIRDENQPPLRWKLGRIIDVHPGADGIVRVVTLKTSDAVTKRAVTKICVLPIDS